MTKSLAPSGIVTFLFSDIEGSTVRWEAHRAEMQRALAQHDELMRAAITANRGRVFKTIGDAFCAAFASASDAIAAALDAQQALLTRDWSEVDGLRVRMSIHAGDAELRDDDYFGPALNRVARLLSAAHGGQVVVSQTAAALAESAMPKDVTLRDLGRHRLKDLPQAEAVYQMIATGLRSDFPPLRSVEGNPTNLPFQPTALLGRELEIAEIDALLRDGRLVTLTGSGGVGKTRTALQVASNAAGSFPDGVWLVDLAPLSDADLVPATVASALRIDLGRSSQVLADLAGELKTRKILIVLDNCEHVVSAAATLADALLRGCTNVSIVATSRETLNVAGESVYRMPSLPEQTAIELFAERARAVSSRFELDEKTAPVVAGIVRRLDGIALAIELAASRVKVLGIERIAKGLDERFKLLSGGNRTALPRQQTLLALIGWSYDLLSERERSMFRQLAIFRGGWTLDAAEAVCEDPECDWDVVELLSSLVEKSLVIADEAGGDMRYRMLESTREYALARLSESPLYDAVAARHCAFFVDNASGNFAEYWHHNAEDWRAKVVPEFDNYRTAIEWGLIDRHDVAAGAAIVANSRLPELEDLVAIASRERDALAPKVRAILDVQRARDGLDRGEPGIDLATAAVDVFAREGENGLLAEAYVVLGNALYKQRKFDEALAAGEKGRVAALATGLPRLIAGISEPLGLWTAMTGNRERGEKLLRDAIEDLRKAGDRLRLAPQLLNLAELLFAEGDVDGALGCIRESIDDVADEDLRTQFRMLRRINFTAYLLAAGNVREAYTNAVSSLTDAVDRKNPTMVAIAAGHLAQIAAVEGDYERAARLVGFVDAEYSRLNAVREMTEQVGYDATMELLRALPAERLAALRDEGAQLHEATAVELALAVAAPR